MKKMEVLRLCAVALVHDVVRTVGSSGEEAQINAAFVVAVAPLLILRHHRIFGDRG